MELLISLRIGIQRINRTGGITPAEQPKYYFSSTGNDANDGLTEETPKQSLTALNSLVLEPGDFVGLKRGDSWNGNITLNYSGTSGNIIKIGAYGEGAKPKIYGSDIISGGWTVHAGNIYKKTGVAAINQLFIDDQRMQVARYPETGYATVTSAPSTSSLSCDALNGALDYTGVICLIHSSSYGFDRRTVTSSSGTTLQLNSAPFDNVNANEKFILVGKLEFLTKAGQWFYDTATSTLYVWTPNGDTPANYTVRGSVRDYGIYATGKNNFDIKNIEVLQQKIDGVYVNDCDYYNISNISSTDADAVGIRDYLGFHGTVENNTVTGANHYGIQIHSGNGLNQILSNNVSKIALPDNLGLSGIGAWYMGSGIYVQNSNTTAYTAGQTNTIKYNRVDNVGYNGIHFANQGLVESNYITNCGFVKNDGGFIYTSGGDSEHTGVNQGSIIRYNIGMYGNGIGSSPYFEGIYADEYSEGVTIEHNSVEGSTRGVFLHNGKNNIARYNTIFNCENGLYASKDGDGNEIYENIVYGKLNQEMVHLNIITGAMTVNNNKYINHYTANPFEIDWTNYYTFDNWKTATGHDAASTFDNSAITGGKTERLIVNPTNATKTFYVNNASECINDVTKAELTGSFTVAAYSSVIVVGLNVDCILDYSDAVSPVITEFVLPETSSSLAITPTTLTATGDATAYKSTLTNVAPTLESSGWSTVPLVYAQEEGSQTFYMWVRDAAGNISESASASCNVTGTAATIGTQTILSLTSGTANAVRAYPVTMTEGGLIKSITIYHSAGNGTEQIIGGIYADDGANHPAALLATTAQTVISTSAEWQTINFTTPVYVEAGTKIWIGWNKNGASTLAYEAGAVTRASKNVTFGALPDPYGTADTYQNYSYSVYVNFLK